MANLFNARILVLLGMMVVVAPFALYERNHPPAEPLKGLCDHLFWPEGGMRNSVLYGGRHDWTRHVYENPLGSGDAAFAHAQVTDDTWAAADGLEDAAHWPGVVFQASWANLSSDGIGHRVLRARAGDRAGLWIFNTSGRGKRSDIYVGHPGGNSGKPFDTVFLHWLDEYVALNVLHRPDRRLENFVFRLNQKQPVCRVVSDL